MPFLKTIYLLLLCIFLVVLLLLRRDAETKDYSYAKVLSSLLLWAVFGSISYGLYLLVPSMRAVVLLDGVYFLSTDFMCFYMMKFVFSYTDYEKPHLPGEKWLLGLLLLDSIDLLLNPWTGWMFTVESTTGKYDFHAAYIDHYSWLLYLHLTFCYGLIAVAIARFFHQMKTASPLYRRKYVSIIIPLFLAALTNVVCVVLDHPYDYSVLLYAVLASIICYMALHLTPNQLIDTAKIAIANNTRLGILCFDELNRPIFANPVLSESSFYLEHQSRMTQFLIAKHAEYQAEGKDLCEWMQTEEYDGKIHYVFCTYQQIHSRRNQLLGYFFLLDEQTEKYEEFDRTRYLAMHDELTGLLNRRSFFEEADTLLKEETDTPRIMLVSNVADFKLLNNIYGEAIADEVLKLQADFVRKYQTEGNLCGRIAGDRFAMLMEQNKFDAQTFRHAVEEIGDYFRNRNIVIRYQIGMYEINDTSESAQSIFHKAELAYSSLRGDSSRLFAVYNQENIDRMMREKRLTRDFEQALEDHNFCMYLQPQMDRTGQCTGAEALVRWQHPELGLLFPDSFIGVLEEAGMIHRLDLEIWNQAGAKLAEWKAEGITDKHISVNISVRDLFYLDVYQEMTGIVERNGINPANLKLEMTESMVMLDRDNNLDTLDRLRSYGFEIEIDDFGSGYSSLNMLKDFPADVLKIDRMFLKETENAGRGRIVLRTTVNLARELGMQIVAEGVETEDQFLDLVDMGVGCFQGYYFDKPIPVSQFETKYFLKKS